MKEDDASEQTDLYDPLFIKELVGLVPLLNELYERRAERR